MQALDHGRWAVLYVAVVVLLWKNLQQVSVMACVSFSRKKDVLVYAASVADYVEFERSVCD